MLQDKLLIWKFKRGSNEALSKIYQRYGDYLLTLAAALLKDINEAEDVLHDVFCRFIEHREKLKLSGSLKSYLGTCVVNLARDRLRARKLQPCELGETTFVDTNGPENYAIFGEQASNLSHAIAQLTYDQQEVIILHLQGNMKFREIASLQGISINTVKSRYRYGLEKLRVILSEGKGK